MVSRAATFAFNGIEVTDVDVQVHLTNGIPAFTIVGLADKAVAESKERVRSALTAMGLALPPKRITINLSPADLVKEGSHYDLAIALGLLAAMGVLPQDVLDEYVVLGELALDGSLTSITGALPAAIGAAVRNKGVIVPQANGAEAAWAGEGVPVLAPANLLTLLNHVRGIQLLSPPLPEMEETAIFYPDMRDIRGQETARRALEIAASGGHNLLMSGPPGSGKSMLASRLPGILPPMDAKEMLSVSMINSVSGMIKDGKLTRARPFRDPHHNCSMAAMIGGGTRAKPGEVSLAHGGILFLDELPEFPRQVLDALRQPLETRQVSIARVQNHVTYPAHFQLIAAMNPCRCGHLDDAARACTKAPLCAADYQGKISGPLLDRIDLHVDVPAAKPADVMQGKQGEATSVVAARVAATRQIQKDRFENETIKLNAQADGELLNRHCQPDDAGKALLEQGVEKLGLSMRGYTRVLRVARTIADMEASSIIRKQHVAEALSFRQRNYMKASIRQEA
jgi:magnesium chelatase family protein